MKRGVLIVVAAALVGAAVWFFALRDRSTGAPPVTSASDRGAGSGAMDPRSPTARAGEPGVASATITVRSERGPIEGATVRLAPDDGDVVAVRTDATGVVHVTALAAGAFAISASAPGFVPAAITDRELAAGEDAAITLTLVAGGVALTGTVTDVNGGPIAGARVDAARLSALIKPEAEVAATLTDKDGAYTLTVPQGRLLVAASSPDYAAASQQVEVGAGGATANFALVPGGVIEGVVRDEKTKQIVAGAIVRATRDGGAAVLGAGAHRVVTLADGKFRLGGLQPGAYELTARAGTRLTHAPTVVGLGVAEEVADVELLVGVGLVVSGVVLDDKGKPVPGADVQADGPRNGERETADAAGAFAFVGLPPGPYRLTATTDKLVPDGRLQIDLVDKDLTNLEVRVREGITITGHVEPRQVCTVTYTPTERDAGGPLGTLLAPSVTTDDGEFSISPALPRPARLEARCPGGDRGGVEITPTPNGPAVVIQVTAGASIAGRVIDAKGKPLAGVQVMAAVDGNEREIFVVNGVVTSGAQTTANANGEYLITGLLPGPYRVTALDRGRPLRPLAPVRVTLAEKEKKTGVDVRVDRADGVITGRVTGADGKPIADAWVSAHQSIQAMVGELARGGGDEKNVSVSTSVMTDDDGALTNDVAPVLTDAAGKFTIANLPHGEFVVIAEAQAGALRGRADKVQPDANIAIQALGMSSLSGTVRSATGPAAIFTLDLVGPTTASRTFTDGTFELGRVDAGAYTITVHSHDGNGEATVTVQPNTPATVAVQLAQNAVVIGKLVGADGKPLADTGVVLLADQGPGHLSVRLEGPPPTSGPDGSFRLEGPAVVSVLAVMLPQRPWSKRPLALEPGKTLDLGTLTVDSGPPPAP